MQQQERVQNIGRPVIDFSDWFDNKEQSNVLLVLSTIQITVYTTEGGNVDQPEPKKIRRNAEVRVSNFFRDQFLSGIPTGCH